MVGLPEIYNAGEFNRQPGTKHTHPSTFGKGLVSNLCILAIPSQRYCRLLGEGPGNKMAAYPGVVSFKPRLKLQEVGSPPLCYVRNSTYFQYQFDCFVEIVFAYNNS